MINTCNFCAGTCFDVSREFVGCSNEWKKEVNSVVNKQLDQPIDPNEIDGFIICSKCEAVNYLFVRE